MIASLSIPVKLTDHTDANLGYVWQKYKACLVAVKTCNMLWEAGNSDVPARLGPKAPALAWPGLAQAAAFGTQSRFG
jgi:hypothetical protein